MPTLNQYGSRIANILGKPNDHVIRERGKDAFKAVFANRIRQSIAKNGIDELLILSCSIPVTEDSSATMRNFAVFKTSSKVPVPMRFHSDAPFTYIGVKREKNSDMVDDGIPFSHRLPLEIKLSDRGDLSGFKRYYTYSNGILSLYMTKQYDVLTQDLSVVKEAVISSIFENPEEVITYYSDDDANDVELPFPNDMLESILLEVLKTEFNYNTPDVEVKS